MDANANVDQPDATEEAQGQQQAADQETAEDPKPTNTSRKAAKARKTKAKLNAALAGKRCPHCTITGHWRVVSSQKKVRYLKCMACGKTEKIAL